MTAIYQRELRSYFHGMTGYVFIAFLLLFSGIYTMFYNLSSGYPNFEYVLQAMTIIFLIAIPILTMRVIAEERRQKTDQLLYTLPVGMTRVVLGKYLAMVTVVAAPCLVMAFYPLLLSTFGTVSLTTAYGALVGFFLLSAALSAIGLLISSLTENQAVAAGLCFGVMLLLYFMSDLSSFVPSSAGASLCALLVTVLVIAVLVRVFTRSAPAAILTGLVGEAILFVTYLAASDSFSGLFGRVVDGLSVFARFSTIPANTGSWSRGTAFWPWTTSKVSSLTSAVTGLYWQSCVNYDADAEELAAWGLDDNAAVVTAVYTAAVDEGEETAEEETFTLRLGNSGTDGTYAMLEGSSMVYLISTDTADSLRYASYASLRSDSICTMDWDTVDRLDITLDGTTYTISFDVTETETEDGTETETLYTWNGQELDSTAVGNMLSAVNSLTATADASGSAGEEPLLTFTFHRSTGDDFAELTLTLYAWDTGSCLASFSGEGSRLVDRSAVTDLTEQIQALFEEA